MKKEIWKIISIILILIVIIETAYLIINMKQQAIYKKGFLDLACQTGCLKQGATSNLDVISTGVCRCLLKDGTETTIDINSEVNSLKDSISSFLQGAN